MTTTKITHAEATETETETETEIGVHKFVSFGPDIDLSFFHSSLKPETCAARRRHRSRRPKSARPQDRGVPSPMREED